MVRQTEAQQLEPAPPTLWSVPSDVRGLRVRIVLQDTEPLVWRRLDLPGDLTLPRVHDVIQAAMGWTNSHLHRFRTGSQPGSPHFLTTFDIDEGDVGVPEDGVRLDQLLAKEGDTLWYEYDFGDGWDHTIGVEEVVDEPGAVRCTSGELACPPEDCGGTGGYEQLADWVRSGRADDRLPGVFESVEHANQWLPLDWHPDHLDLDEVNDLLAVVAAEPVGVTGGLAELLDHFEQRGIRSLRHVLARPLSHEDAVVTDAEAARLTESYRRFLETVADGVTLTAAGYLPPAVVRRVAEDTGIGAWWIGGLGREDSTPPVASLRGTARALGLVTVRKGRLTPTSVGLRFLRDPRTLWQHIVGRLPLGTKEFDRHAGWLALAVVGSGVPFEDVREEVSDLLALLGWRVDGGVSSRPSAQSPTLRVLQELAGESRTGGRLTGTDPAVAATARAVVRR